MCVPVYIPIFESFYDIHKNLLTGNDKGEQKEENIREFVVIFFLHKYAMLCVVNIESMPL